MGKSTSFLGEIKDPKRTQVVVENLVLGDLIKDEITTELEAKFVDFGKPIVTSIQIFLVPETKEDSKKTDRIESITFEQPSQLHYQSKKTIITSSHNKTLEILLNK